MSSRLVLLMASAGVIVAMAIDLPPVPVTPSTITLAWDYPPELLAKTHVVVDPTTGQSVTVTNDPITFHVWRTFDLTNWVAVTSVVNQTTATIRFVNQWADFGVTASNATTVSVMSNIANMQAMPTRSTLKTPVFGK